MTANDATALVYVFLALLTIWVWFRTPPPPRF